MPDLTIIIPAFRCGKYLPATVRSALTFPSANLLIGDDCGGDDTLDVARQLERENPSRIHVIANPRNLGMTANWQRLMEQVNTPLALKLDGDDLVSARYIAAAITLMAADPSIAIAACSSSYVDSEFGLSGDCSFEPVAPGDFEIMEGVDAARFLLNWKPFPASSSTIYRMDLWRRVGGFDGELKWCPDREIWFRLGRRSRIAFSRKEGVRYRLLEQSVTQQSLRNDRTAYELSRMLRRAQREWPEPELNHLFRQQFAITAKAFAGSSLRALRAGRLSEVLPRALRAAADFSRVL